jgi:hypothetical protein
MVGSAGRGRLCVEIRLNIAVFSLSGAVEMGAMSAVETAYQGTNVASAMGNWRVQLKLMSTGPLVYG